MSVTVRIPRVLSQAVTTGLRHEAEGETLGAVLESLFTQGAGAREPLARRRRRDQAPCPDLRRRARADLHTSGRTVIGGPGASGGQWRLIRRLISLRGSAEHEPDRKLPTAPEDDPQHHVVDED